MAKVTNIYIDTTGFTDEQYAAADSAMDALKSIKQAGWPVGDASPRFKRYPVLGIGASGERQHLNTVDELLCAASTRSCVKIGLHDLLLLQMESVAGKSMEIGKLTLTANPPITTIDRMTPERERAVVNGLMDALLSNRLISKMSHGVVTGAMQGYYSANDTPP